MATSPTEQRGQELQLALAREVRETRPWEARRWQEGGGASTHDPPAPTNTTAVRAGSGPVPRQPRHIEPPARW
jgi:hypothetical protein